MKYEVHICLVKDIEITNVEADNQVEAIKKAEKDVILHDTWDVDCYMVYEVGDYEHGREYDKNYQFASCI